MQLTQWRSLDETFDLENEALHQQRAEAPEAWAQEIGGRYRIQGTVGIGGMSTVYRALDRLTGEVVALKQMRAPSRGSNASQTMADWQATGAEQPRGAALGSTARLRYALAKEFQTLSTLRHPNIISVLDYGFHNDRDPYYTMELLHGAREIEVAAQGLPLRGQIELLVETLRALAYLHRRGVLHRDLKPANILVTDRVRVLDFGIAVSRSERKSRRAGTRGFIPPEVYRGQPFTEAGDLFAVGVIAYRIFVGAHPFEIGATDEDRRSFDPELAKLSVLADVPAVSAVIERLLKEDPRERFASAEETIDAFAAAIEMPLRRETRATRESFLQSASFVDRDDERAALDDAVAGVLAGRGGVALLGGPSGIGKSRLIDEFQTLVQVLGVRVVRGQAAAEAGDGFRMWRAPLRRLLLYGVPEGSALGVLKVLIDDLPELLEREIADTPLSPQSAKEQVVAAIQGLVCAQDQPTVVLLEDLHWGQESIDVLAGLSAALSDRPVLVVGTYRPEEAPPSLREIQGQRLRLSPLASSDVALLAEGMLGVGSERVATFLQARTEGNPFFVVETVRALAEEVGALDRVRSAPLPERIEAAGIADLVRRRLGLVDAAIRPLLSWCAVLGREPDLAVLRHALGVDAVDAGLLSLSELGLLETRDNRWRFSHDRFREQLLAELDDRAGLHGAVAAAIEAVYGPEPSVAASLAYHHGLAGDHVSEGRFAAMAGQRAQQLGAYSEAGTWLRRALALHPQRVDLEAPDAEELSLQLVLGTVLMPTEGWASAETRRLYARVIELAEKTGQAGQVGPALMGMCLVNMMSGRVHTAVGFADQMIQLAEHTSDSVALQNGLILRGQLCHWLGEHAETRRYTEQGMALFAAEELPQHFARFSWDPRMAARVCHPWACWMLGETDRSVTLTDEGFAFEADAPNPFSRAMLLQSSGWVALLRRETDRVRRDAAELRAISEQYGFAPFLVLATFLDGWAAVQDGDHQAGLDQLRPAFAAWAETGSALVTTFYTMVFADACLAAGAIDEGIEAVEGALSGGLPTEERCYHPELHRLHGVLLSQRGDLDGAASALRAALALAEAHGAHSWVLRSAASLAALTGGDAERAALREARGRLAGQQPTADTRLADEMLSS